MLKLPKGLKKKKKGKKSKHKGEQELFTEEELEKYKREHQQQSSEADEGPAKENEEWSKFKDLTTGVDSILKKTQGDLDRIKSTSFFQRVPAGPKKVEPVLKQEPQRPVVEITEADFPQRAAVAELNDDQSEYGVTDDESEEDDQDDIFDTSYVEAVERGEVKLAYVPDSPEEFQDDDIFDTSHVDAIIRGQEAKTSKGKKGLDIGIAVEVLTGRIDNVTIATKRPSKRVIPGDLLLEDSTGTTHVAPATAAPEAAEKSILDLDSDILITSSIDLSVSLHTALIQQQNTETKAAFLPEQIHLDNCTKEDEEVDEFTLLATESLEVSSETTKKLRNKQIDVEPVLQESWSAFEADKNESVFADGIVEDDILDPYLGEDDPFDTSFADAVVPPSQIKEVKKEAVILEDDDEFDPRAEELLAILNNRRKSSVRIHLTDPSGVRESITSDDVIINTKGEEQLLCDLLKGSTTDLSQLIDLPLNPIDINTDFDPFDTSNVDKIAAPGKIELKFLEQELIGSAPAPAAIYRVLSDPDFDPRAEEPQKSERRPSRPENLTVSKSVVFNVEGDTSLEVDTKGKINKPLTPYYTRELSITEDLNEEAEAADTVPDTLTRTRSDEDLVPKTYYQAKRRHSEFSQPKVKTTDLLHCSHSEIKTKVLTPSGPKASSVQQSDIDPFDTSFASNIAPGRTELKLLAKEFSCEEESDCLESKEKDLLEPADDLFQVKALSPEPPERNKPQEDFDPFDTSFADDLNPGRTELKLLESEFLGH